MLRRGDDSLPAPPRGQQGEATEQQRGAARLGHDGEDEIVSVVTEAERRGEAADGAGEIGGIWIERAGDGEVRVNEGVGAVDEAARIAEGKVIEGERAGADVEGADEEKDLIAGGAEFKHERAGRAADAAREIESTAVKDHCERAGRRTGRQLAARG